MKFYRINTQSIVITLIIICLAAGAVGAGQDASKNVRKQPLEYSFDIWDWTAPAQDLKLFENWAADLKGIGLTRIEMSVPWNLLEPEPGKIDLTWIKQRQAVCKKLGLGMRLRINSYYSGCVPSWYKGDLWHDADGKVAHQGLPSIVDERFWEHYGPLCTAIAKEFHGEDMYYNAFIGVHAELKYADWWTYDPSSLKLWKEAIKSPRPEWLSRVVGDDATLPEKPPVPGITKGSPDTDPANLAFIAFREHCWRTAIERFTKAIKAGDPDALISSPLGESYRRGSAQMSNLDYWGLTRGSDQVVHSYDFFWHPGNTPVWHVRAVLEAFKGITGLPVNFEFDTLLTIRQFGYTDEVVGEMYKAIADSNAGIKIANMSYIPELPSTFSVLKRAGVECVARKELPAVPKPKDTVLLFYSKWANNCYREETEWLHDAQFGYWKLLTDLGINVRVICEDNLSEDLTAYKGVVLAFSPLDLIPPKDQLALRRTNLPLVADVLHTPRLRPSEPISISGEAGKLEAIPGLKWDSLEDFTAVGSEYKIAMKGGGLPFLIYKPKCARFGFPLGYYYLNGADQTTCRNIMSFALTKAGIK